MKRYKIRFYGLGIYGVTETSFDAEPTVDTIETRLAKLINNKKTNIEQDDFYGVNWKTYEKNWKNYKVKGAMKPMPPRFTITYEEINHKQTK